MTNTNTDANGNRFLRTPAGIIANILVAAPTGFFATRVTRTLIEKARPSDLTKAQNKMDRYRRITQPDLDWNSVIFH
jgi:hypothetical protein